VSLLGYYILSISQALELRVKTYFGRTRQWYRQT